MLSNLQFVRPQSEQLLQRLKEPRRFIQVVSGVPMMLDHLGEAEAVARLVREG